MLIEASKNAIWLKILIFFIKLKYETVNIHCDSQIALHLATNLIIDNKMRQHQVILYQRWSFK